MAKYPYSPSEIENFDRLPNPFNPNVPGTPLFHLPCSPREAYLSLFSGEPVWMPYGVETSIFCPDVIPDNRARGFVIEKNMVSPDQFGGKDMFGIEWVFVPVAGGSMENPDNPHPMSDVNDWKDVLTFPDIESWDWETSGKENKEMLINNGKANMAWFLNGMGFERLVSFMGFEDAAVALVDEDQADALHELLDKLCDLHIALVDKIIETYGEGIQGFTVHDDWGSQRAPFFSHEAAEEFFVPRMKRLTDHIKSKGLIAELHSCGHIETQIDNIVAAGWQTWTPMAMNDTQKLYEEWGDKIVIGVVGDPVPADATPEVKRQMGREYAEKFFKPGKVGAFSLYGAANSSDEYLMGMYEVSRQK